MTARDELERLFKSRHACPFVFAHCPVSDQSDVLHAVRDDLPDDDGRKVTPCLAVVDCQLVLTVRQLYETILNQLSAYPVRWKDGMRNWDGQVDGFKYQYGVGRDGDYWLSKRRRLFASATRDEYDDLSLPRWDTTVQPDRQPLDPPRDSSEYLNLMLSRLSAIFDDDNNDDETGPRRRFLLFQHAEHLTTLPSVSSLARGGSILNTLARIEEFIKKPVTVIFTSRLSFEKLREPSLPVPRILRFTAPSEQDIVKRLTFYFKPAPSDIILSQLDYRTLFRGLVEHVVSTSSTYTAGHMDDVAFLVARLWTPWKISAEFGNPPCRVLDTARLAQAIKDVFANELAKIADPRSYSTIRPTDTAFAGRLSTSTVTESSAFLNSIQRFQAWGAETSWFGVSGRQTQEDQQQQVVQEKGSESLIASLSVLARWLLLSAYYASVNRPSTDVRYFVKLDEDNPKKGKKGKRRSPSKSPTKQAPKRADLNGGRLFALERMLSIFKALAYDDLESAVRMDDVLLQTNMLISVKLLQRGSADNKLYEGVKLRCQLDKDTAERIARSVGLSNWRDYLDEHD